MGLHCCIFGAPLGAWGQCSEGIRHHQMMVYLMLLVGRQMVGRGLLYCRNLPREDAMWPSGVCCHPLGIWKIVMMVHLFLGEGGRVHHLPPEASSGGCLFPSPIVDGRICLSARSNDQMNF